MTKVPQDECLIKVFQYIVHNRTSFRNIFFVSKRFYQLCFSQNFWDNMKYQQVFSLLFVGQGCECSEYEEWIRYGLEAGLPVVNIAKLQWLAHNTSRLKIYYGTLKQPALSSRWNLLHCFESVDRIQQGGRIVILGHDTLGLRISQSRKILQQLMFMIPLSATKGHNNINSCPILPGFQLLKTEPSPAGSRSSKATSSDPGIRLEGHHQYTLKYRRVGDDRLSFVQFDYRLGQFVYKQELYSDLMVSLFQKSVGNIIVIDYIIEELTDLPSILQSLISLITRKLQVKDNVLTNMNIRQSQRAIDAIKEANTPILFLLAIPQSLIWNASTHSANNEASRRAVHHIVSSVHCIVRDIMKNERNRRHIQCVDLTRRKWFIQPISANSDIGNLREGIFSGINWLIRTTMQSN